MTRTEALAILRGSQQELQRKLEAVISACLNLDLSGVDLHGVQFGQTRSFYFPATTLDGANLSRVEANHAMFPKLTKVNLEGATLRAAWIQRMTGCNLRNADLTELHIGNGTFERCDFTGARLHHVRGYGCYKVAHCNFRTADMTYAQLKESVFSNSKFQNAILRGAKLMSCTWKKCNFTGANLAESDLQEAEFQSADLTGANLSWADLRGAKLQGANLTNADLSNACLLNADLTDAILDGANVAGASFEGAKLDGVDLARIKGLRGKPVTRVPRKAGPHQTNLERSLSHDRPNYQFFAKLDCDIGHVQLRISLDPSRLLADYVHYRTKEVPTFAQQTWERDVPHTGVYQGSTISSCMLFFAQRFWHARLIPESIKVQVYKASAERLEELQRLATLAWSEAFGLEVPTGREVCLPSRGVVGATLTEVATIDTKPEEFISYVTFSPDGKLLVGGGETRVIKFWQVGTWKEKSQVRTTDSIRSVHFFPNGKHLVVGGRGWQTWLFDLSKNNAKKSFHVSGNAVPVPDNKRFLASGDGRLSIWDIKATKPTFRSKKLHRHSGPIDCSPDGRYAAIGTGINVCVWDLVTCEQLHLLRVHTQSVRSVAFSPDGKILASGSQDRTIRFWDVATGKEIEAVQAEKGQEIYSLAYLSDGSLACSTSGRIIVWDTTTYEIRAQSGVHGTAYGLAVSPDGRFIAGGYGGFGKIRIWSM